MRGYKEEGTTTTPFDMVMLNDLDRFHLVIDVIDRVPGLADSCGPLRQEIEDRRLHARAYTREHGEDDPEICRLDVAGLKILVVNAGSTSLKLSAWSTDDSSVPVAVARRGAADDVGAVAHRVVHGGARFREPVLIDDDVLAPRSKRWSSSRRCTTRLRCRRSARPGARFPDVPHVAVFDTAFHATIPEVASTYAVPRRWREEWGIRRYGFHGLSVAWAAERVPVPRLVVCHLGGGCSVTAVLDGRSVDTTMGFSPLEGVPMATRSGSIDPEILLYLLRHERHHDPTSSSRRSSTSRGCSRSAALLGSRSSRLRRSRGRQLALAVFCYRVAGSGGLDDGRARRARRARLHRRHR